jgi:hypothetical protein
MGIIMLVNLLLAGPMKCGVLFASCDDSVRQKAEITIRADR